jgi:hypothetical protein
MVTCGFSGITLKKIAAIEQSLRDTLRDDEMVDIIIEDIKRILNLDAIMEYRKSYYHKRQDDFRAIQRKRNHARRSDPEYRERERQAGRERYARQNKERQAEDVNEAQATPEEGVSAL